MKKPKRTIGFLRFVILFSNTFSYLKQFTVKEKKTNAISWAFKAPVIERRKYLAILEKKNHLVNIFFFVREYLGLKVLKYLITFTNMPINKCELFLINLE